MENVTKITKRVTATVTRPANTTAYAALDVLADKTADASVLTFADAVPVENDAFEIVEANLRIDHATVIASDFRLHLYSSEPTAIVDNAAYNLPAADRSKYLGYIDWADPIDLGDTQWAQAQPTLKGRVVRSKSTNQSLYAILQTIDGFTPASAVVHTIELVIALV